LTVNLLHISEKKIHLSYYRHNYLNNYCDHLGNI